MKMIVWFVFVLGALSAAGEVFIGKVGQKVTLDCGFSSYHRSLEWHRGSDRLYSVDQRGFSRKGNVDLVQRSVVRQMNLEISNVRETDAGQFACSADGTRQEHSLVVVSVSVSITPSNVLQLGDKATLQCEVKGLVKDCEVKWKSPNQDSPGTSLTVQLKSVTSLHDGTWHCNVNCGNKQMSESLTIKVQELLPTTKSPSKPKDNAKDNTETSCATCAEKDSSLELLGLHWWVWVAIGVGCLVAILLMVCVIVLCMRVRRRKRKFLKMKKVQQRTRPKQYCQCDHPTAAAKPKQGRRREKPSALPLHAI